jgi:hypothetical protein
MNVVADQRDCIAVDFVDDVLVVVLSGLHGNSDCECYAVALVAVDNFRRDYRFHSKCDSAVVFAAVVAVGGSNNLDVLENVAFFAR